MKTQNQRKNRYEGGIVVPFLLAVATFTLIGIMTALYNY
jgi:hypothetical protein